MSNSLIQQLPVLLGVGVGALATYAATSLADRARWRRERTARWDEARMRAYADYGNASRPLSNLAIRIAAGRGLPHSAEPLAADAAAMEALAGAETERAGVWESVMLLGDPETVGAAREWHRALWCLESFARGLLTGADQWTEAWTAAGAARDKFYERARRDLGVPGGALPVLPGPPQWLQDLGAAGGAGDDDGPL